MEFIQKGSEPKFTPQIFMGLFTEGSHKQTLDGSLVANFVAELLFFFVLGKNINICDLLHDVLCLGKLFICRQLGRQSVFDMQCLVF